ncbi:MAG TPA: FAD-dependent oxidoreductase [Alphaproteobacteria bacterium]|nr:FAD-dependent oxidoreductase [Alphaproteobacteria bacterium]
MATRVDTDLCIIGGGSGGLSVAAGAAQMGARCVLVEHGKMGGDCLNYGCVPSKSLIAAAQAADTIARAARFGVSAGPPHVDFGAVNAHVHGVIGAIAPHDSVERFEGLGVRVIQETGRFTGPATLNAGDAEVHAKRFVIATGSAPLVPPIPGLETVSYFTNETIFDLQEAPERLIIVGGGPIGLEMAQAHRRLGCAVEVVEANTILNKDDPELADVVRRQVLDEGVSLYEGATVTGVAPGAGGGVRVTLEGDDAPDAVEGSHLLLAIGRAANVDGLGLDEAGVAYTKRGIEVDARLRTTNKKIFAIGDVAGGYQFTHVASYHAGIVIRNALFRLPAKADHDAVPWVTYTDPELAHVGLTETAARDAGHNPTVVRAPFEEIDRARAERREDGFIKAVIGKRGRVLGASIVGVHAGELILPWVFAVGGKLSVKDMASVIAPYPTLSEISKRAAGSYYTPNLFSDRTRWIVRLLLKLG